MTSERARDAIEAILARRARVDDPNLAQASDEPNELVGFVLAGRRVPGAVLRADVLDALLLTVHIRQRLPHRPAALDRMEADLLTLGASLGLTLRQMAVPLGLRSRQAVQQRHARLLAAAHGGLRDPRAHSACLRAEAAEAAWSRRHGATLLRAVQALLDRRGQWPAELAQDLDELAASLAAAYADLGGEGFTGRLRVVAARARLLLAEPGAPANVGGLGELLRSHQRVVAGTA